LIFFLDVTNIFLFASGFLMLYTAYRDRKLLRGYNLLGTLLIMLAITLFLGLLRPGGLLDQPSPDRS
jgi:hypothetical protein